jgi:hypothetical protein
VFQFNATKELGQEVWYVAQSGVGNPYRIRNAVSVYGGFYVGDTQSSAVGLLSDEVGTHFGEVAQWEFDVGPVYNASKGGIVNSLELISLPGRAPFGTDGSIWLSMTRDGVSFSTERSISPGKAGEFRKRLMWNPRTNFRTWIGFRFRGLGSFLPGFSGLEADITPLGS